MESSGAEAATREKPPVESPDFIGTARTPIPRGQLVATLVVLLLIVVSTSFVFNYQPLREGRRWQESPDCVEDLDRFLSVSGEPIDAVRIECAKEGTDVLWAFGIRNEGWLPITVTDLGPIGEQWWPLGPISATVALEDGAAEDEQPFAPFTIAPGEEYFIRFRSTTIDDCSASPGRGTLFLPAGVDVTYKIGPIVRHDRAPAGPSIQVVC